METEFAIKWRMLRHRILQMGNKRFVAGMGPGDGEQNCRSRSFVAESIRCEVPVFWEIRDRSVRLGDPVPKHYLSSPRLSLFRGCNRESERVLQPRRGASAETRQRRLVATPHPLWRCPKFGTVPWPPKPRSAASETPESAVVARSRKCPFSVDSARRSFRHARRTMAWQILKPRPVPFRSPRTR